MTDDGALQARVTELEDQNAELRRKLKLYGPSTERLPGSRVVLVFFGLISLSMVLAAGLWFSGRKTARERAARPAPAVTPGRVDEAGRALIRGLHGCLVETRIDEPVDIRLEARLTPAGTIGLVDATIKPSNEQFVPCVRRTPAGVKVDPQAPEAGSQGAPTLEVRYLVEHPQEGTYQARWSWRLMP